MKKLFFALSLFISNWLSAQVYNPSIHVVVNDAIGQAAAAPIDSRSMYYDGVNFKYRWYQSTTEVQNYLSTPASRTGNFIIIVDSGGVLNSNGTYTNGYATFYMYKDGVANGNLVELNLLGGGGGGGSGTLTNLTATNGSGLTWTITNPTTTPNLSVITAAGGDVSGPLNLLTVNKFNGQLPSYYLNYNNLFNTPVVPAQLNPSCVGCTITGSYPNLVWTVTGTGFTTAGVDLIALSSSTVALDTFHYRKVDTLIGVNDSTLQFTVNGQLYSITLRGGSHGGGGGGGTVTSVSVVTANGVSGSVANPTSTPAITLTLGAITPSTVNGLTLAAISNGFTITGGSGTPHTLTVNTNNTSVAGSNTGDVTLAGQTYLSLSGQQITANAVDLSGGNATGTLAAARFPALTGPVTTSAGSLTTSVTNNAITNAMLAQMNTLTIKGNNTGGTANAADLTVAQVNAILPVFTTSLNGLVPTPGSATGKVLSDAGTWVTNGTGNTNTNVGSGYRWAIPGTNQIKTVVLGLGVLADSVTNANAITLSVDTSKIQYKFQDSIFVHPVGASGLSLGYTGSDTIYLKKLVAGANITLTQNNDSSITITSSGGGGGGITTVGAFGSQAQSTNGGTISGSSIYFQPADTSNPGMVNTVTQRFAGSKIFTSAWTVTTLTTPGGIYFGDNTGLQHQTGAGISTQVLHGGGTPSFGAVQLTTDVGGILPIANGGNGTSTPSIAAGTGISVTGSWGAYIINNTTLGTVTSINGSGGTTGLNITGGPITTSGTFTVSGTLVPANGGTGLSSLTPYAVVTGGATATGTLQQVSGLGTSGQVLTSNGAGVLPTWQTPSSGPGGGIGVDSVITITSGSASTVTNGYNVIRFNPTSVISSYTLTLPTTWHTSNDLKIVFTSNATIVNGQPMVTTLTIVNGSGQTLSQAVAPISAVAGESIEYHLISGVIDQRIL